MVDLLTFMLYNHIEKERGVKMFSKLLKIKLVEMDMTAKELALRLGTTQQNISAKMKRDNFSEKEMLQIAEALDLDLNIMLEQKKPE